jgi:tetratricopeptide (TPR) repeat protein
MNQTTALSLSTKIASAFSHHQAGDVETAETLYRSILSEDRDNLNGLHLLGLLLHQKSATKEAIALLERAVLILERTGDVQAGHAAIYNNLGNALKAGNRRQEARMYYSRGLALDADSAELHANFGNALLDDGDWTAAVASYHAALRLAPTHAGALMNLACILIEKGPPEEALPACRQLAATAPNDPNAQFLLGRALGQVGDHGGAVLALQQCLKLDPLHTGALYWLGRTLAKIGMAHLAVQFLEPVVAMRPDDASAYTELGNALLKLGDTERAFSCFRKLGELRPLTTWFATQRPADFSALAITSPGVANTPPEFLFANAAHDSHFFALLPGVEPDENLLRKHGDIVVNLVSDADQARDILTTAAALIDRLGKPVVNHPSKVLCTSREMVAAQLSGIEECRVPRTIRLTRPALGEPDLASALQGGDFSFPLLLRLAGGHGGEAFEKIDTPHDVDRFVATHAGDMIYAIRYIDYQSADGYYRKYRFVLTDEAILPYHLAIGDHWKVHHYTTNMDRHVWMQNEERIFLEEPSRVFSPGHYAAMAEIRTRIGLDFLGIDCSLDHSGNLLLFEVNASVLIHNDNADFAYKSPACIRIKQAFEAMLRRKAAKPSSSTTQGL